MEGEKIWFSRLSAALKHRDLRDHPKSMTPTDESLIRGVGNLMGGLFSLGEGNKGMMAPEDSHNGHFATLPM